MSDIDRPLRELPPERLAEMVGQAREIAKVLAQGVVGFAKEFIEGGVPAAVVHVAILSAVVGMASTSEGIPATAQWLRDLADNLETAKGDFIVSPGGTA